jgi:hypothetical protein
MRIEKGWILYELGHCEPHGDLWIVKAQDGQRYYTVDLERDLCSCYDCRESENTCKHLYEATIAESKQ